MMDEFDNFIIKQTHFNTQVQNQLQEKIYIVKNLHDVLERTANDVKGLTKHFTMVQTQLEQIAKVQKDLLAETVKRMINMLLVLQLEVVLLLRILYIPRDILKELNKSLN